ncbi:FkbM family methyltransferase [Opitutales bacterium]|nr:FkbM family methyltransferase [Opitutales bacterium]
MITPTTKELPWLYEHRTNVSSQHGEDGIVEKIFESIGATNKWCVDIGAHDGQFLSNSWRLVSQDQWSGVLVEADPTNFEKLASLYQDRSNVSCLQEFVCEERSIDTLLEDKGIPNDFDLLSIDIDGMDYNLWAGLKKYRPRVVIIEANASMGPDVLFIQNDPGKRIGSSALAMVELGREKGYELVAHLVSNCIFVRKEDFPLLKIKQNGLETLFTSPFVPRVVSDLDGVHYLLKEGPWGFTGMVKSNTWTKPEDGFKQTKRLLQHWDVDSTLKVHATTKPGFLTEIRYPKKLRRTLEHFFHRMKEYYKDL